MTINDGITDHEQYAAACRYQNGFLGHVDPITAFMAGAEWARDHLAGQFEKAEQERDGARARLAEAAAEIRAQGETIAELAAENRPLTPDAITDEMVKRGVEKFRSLPTAMSAHARVSIILTAALTEPPARPEGAERWETWLSRRGYLHDKTGASRADLAALADDLATETGLAPTNPEEER